MRRRLLTSASIWSALPLAAIAVAWAWSFVHPTYATFTRQGERCRAWLASGRVGIDNEPQVAAALAERELDLKMLNSLSGGQDLLVAPPSRVPARWSRSSALVLPGLAAVFAALLALPPAVRLTLRRFRAASGCCPVCGYLLTGNVSGACPECGTPLAYPPCLGHDAAAEPLPRASSR